MDIQARQAPKSTVLGTTKLTGMDWVQANLGKIIRISVIALAAILLIAIAVVVYHHRSNAAESAFGAAMSTYSTPIPDGSQPIPPGMKTFSSAAERAKVSNPQFAAVASKYGSTEAGENALYFSGLTAAEMGQNGQAETDLKKAAHVRNGNIASLAKLALANLYAQSSRTSDAVKLFQELIAKPTSAVPAGTAQLQLAAMYETTNPAEANKIYATLKDKDKTGAAGEIAAQKLGGTK